MLSVKRIFKYIWPHVKKHWVSFSIVFIFYTIGVIFDVIIKSYLYKEMIDAFSSSMTRDAILHQVLHLLILVGASILIFNIGYRIGDYALGYFESKVMEKMNNMAFGRLLDHSYTFFSNNFSGSLVAKARRFSRSFETFADVLSFQIWFSIVILTGVLIVFFLKVPLLGYIFLVWSFIYFGITILFIKYKIKYDLLEAEADSKVTGRLADVISNILNVKIFSTDKIEKNDFQKVVSEEEKKRLKAWNFSNFQNLVQSILMAILQIIAVYVSIKLWYQGKLTIGMIVLVQSYMFSLFGNLWILGRAMAKAIKSLTDMQEMVDIFDITPDVSDRFATEALKTGDGKVEFNNVSFSYVDDVDVLKDFNFIIEPGQKIGLVGHSGSGKSTITKLLLRFVDIYNGSILIDGQNISNLSQNDLRSLISYVPQDPILFHRTIRENIAYSKPKATEQEIVNAAKSAHAHEFIANLPHGYETMVGERGIKLSGGERQRVAIARAMLKDSPILVLDEATSSLDSLSESYIQEALQILMKNKTTIVIAHRLSTIQKMDRILVLDKGAIVEDGTHKELLEKDGIYAELWNHQSGGFIE